MTTELATVDSNPQSMIATALERGADPAVLEKLLDLAERYNANQARKAYVLAMSKFKAEVPPVLAKDATVDFTNRSGQRTHYRYANLGSVIAVATPIMSKHELSVSWEAAQPAPNMVEVTCHITHAAGHRESVTLKGPIDESGNKNPIQMIGSTTEYLRRYTFLCATGLATGDVDTDGRPEHQPAKAPTQAPADDLPAALRKLGNGETATMERAFDRVEPPPAGKKAHRVWFIGDPRDYPTMHSMENCQHGDVLQVTHKVSEFNGKLYYWVDEYQSLQDEKLPMEWPEKEQPPANPPADKPIREIWPEDEFNENTSIAYAKIVNMIDRVKSPKTGKYGPWKAVIQMDGKDIALDTFSDHMATLARNLGASGDEIEIAYNETPNGRYTNRTLIGLRAMIMPAADEPTK